MPIDSVRFRANVYFDAADPWSEFGWIDREIQLAPPDSR
jgi:hypothetical protein